MKRLAEAWASIPLRVKGLIVVAIPLAALLAVTSGLYFLQRTQNQEQVAIREILRVRSQIQTVLTLLLDAETGVRGYGVSEDPSFLRPYRDSFDTLPGALAELEEITGDNAGQAARARRIRFLAGQKLEVLAQLSQPAFAHRDYGPGEPLIQEDNELMTQLRDELGEMRTTEEGRLRAQLAQARATRENQPYVFGVALLAGLVLGILAALLFTTGIVQRVTRIEESAHRLSKGEPLLDRPPGKDEIGRLAQALQEASELLATREQELRHARDRAETASLAKSDFLSRTSHELRTPLTAIRGLAMTLHNMEHNEVEHDALGRIVHASENLTRLLNDFLDISRIEAGVLHFDIEKVMLPSLLPDTLKLLTPRAEQKNITLTLEGADDVPNMQADPQRLEQVLYNLIGNAIKYNERGGSVTVVCSEPQPGRVRIAVVDDGPGIPIDKLPRLFTPYDRLGAENTSEKGVGLGLPISKSLAELMDGELGVESKDGEGSTFYIDLPAAT